MKVTRVYKISKTINAPIDFVYDWCTDFRNDDPKLTGSKSKRKVLEKTKQQAIYVASYLEDGKPSGHVSVVTLKPPNAWHLETAGNEKDLEIGDYKLAKLGKNKTRIDLVFRESFVGIKAPTSSELVESTSVFWDKLIVHLLKDYAKKS